VRKDVGVTDAGVVVLSHERFRPTGLMSRPLVVQFSRRYRETIGQCATSIGRNSQQLINFFSILKFLTWRVGLSDRGELTWRMHVRPVLSTGRTKRFVEMTHDTPTLVSQVNRICPRTEIALCARWPSQFAAHRCLIYAAMLCYFDPFDDADRLAVG
jgi:hypothetical protein